MSGWRGWLLGLPGSGALGDEVGHGQGGFLEVVAASGPALQGPPLLGFGDGVLDADPCRGLLVALLFPAGGLFGRGILAGFLWRGADLSEESRARPWWPDLAGQPGSSHGQPSLPNREGLHTIMV